jgi:predicted NBD/HSP70 family sugar kinase
VVLLAPGLGWEDVPVARELADRIGVPGLPVTIENEAGLAALAELTEGAGRGLAHFVDVSGEVGIGAGVVLDGELFHGAHGFGGQFGHMTVEPEGLPCGCGSYGCLETRAGLDALLAAAGEGGVSAGASAAEGVARLRQRAEAGDAAAIGALREGGRWLGVGLAIAANLLDPEAFVLGGFLARLAPHIAPAAEQEMRERLLTARGTHPDVLVSQLGPDAASRGGAILALRRVLDDPGMLAGEPAPHEVHV